MAMGAKEKSQWHCTIGNLKRWGDHYKLRITKDELNISAKLIDRENGIVEFEWSPSHLSFSEVVKSIGDIPLPPYIIRKTENEDRERYQTVYSREDGAVAAPTAGLHFTDSVFASLKEKNIAFEYLTLHVSAGTFQPVKVQNAVEHPMHEEQIIVTRENVENLIKARTPIAVGTTSLRTMESIYWYGVKLLNDPSSKFLISQADAYQLKPVDKSRALNAVLEKMDNEDINQLVGETSIYILPGYDFKTCDALITNFHQPGSTLMLLVAAFVGNDWKKIYETALSTDYRFLSYGDSSLLFRGGHFSGATADPSPPSAAGGRQTP
jgi:S-adenosylmethionine:tRNA ribosyltransferase-isomerase